MSISWDHDQPLARCQGESAAAVAALGDYARMGPRRSLRELLERYSQQATNAQATGKPPTGHWYTLCGWSTRHDWQARVIRFDELVAQAEQELWEQRRAELRQRDWNQAGELRDLVAAALPSANQFIESRRRTIRGQSGQPDREIITMSFDVTDLSRVLEIASKLQRLATGDSTENVELSGSVLDSLISAELARLAHQRQAPASGETTGEASG